MQVSLNLLTVFGSYLKWWALHGLKSKGASKLCSFIQPNSKHNVLARGDADVLS